MKKVMIVILGLNGCSALYAMNQNQQKPSADVMALLQQNQSELNNLVRIAQHDSNQQVKNAANQVNQVQQQISQMQKNAANMPAQGDQPPAAVKKLIEQHQQAIQNLIKEAKTAASSAVEQAAQKLEATQNELRTKMENSPNSNPNIRQRKLAKKVQ